MSGTIPKRRRWPWIILAAVLLFVGGPVAWQYRPLNATEKALVGVWRGGWPTITELTFSPDRRYRRLIVRNQDRWPLSGGAWHAADQQISMKQTFQERPDPPAFLARLERYFRRPKRSRIEFLDADRFRLIESDGDTIEFRREATETPYAGPILIPPGQAAPADPPSGEPQ